MTRRRDLIPVPRAPRPLRKEEKTFDVKSFIRTEYHDYMCGTLQRFAYLVYQIDKLVLRPISDKIRSIDDSWAEHMLRSSISMFRENFMSHMIDVRGELYRAYYGYQFTRKLPDVMGSVISKMRELPDLTDPNAIIGMIFGSTDDSTIDSNNLVLNDLCTDIQRRVTSLRRVLTDPTIKSETIRMSSIMMSTNVMINTVLTIIDHFKISFLPYIAAVRQYGVMVYDLPLRMPDEKPSLSRSSSWDKIDLYINLAYEVVEEISEHHCSAETTTTSFISMMNNKQSILEGDM